MNEENKTARIGGLNGQLSAMALRNDGSYEKTIDEIQRLSAGKPYNLRNLYADFILDSTHQSSLVLLTFSNMSPSMRITSKNLILHYSGSMQPCKNTLIINLRVRK
ncbi:hypothetical protein KUH03_22385 [Sphingobacterium sp. E70]|uniref:hypothetical protein n=1 Tax=Sphingobacterium sp. E70 TaxID=2853439 RepID=UPI00211C558E|nr:hypothetical protein [Sphingobacterium sp. E70]ULT22216.1 hypothetical protein KUH03_22385 [Sphingobacterium sp. E70]